MPRLTYSLSPCSKGSSMLRPTESPRPSRAPMLAASMVPGPPPVMMAKPRRASSVASARAASYIGSGGRTRAEPKNVTAGPTLASASKPATNSAWIRSTRQGSLSRNSGALSGRSSSLRSSFSRCTPRRTIPPVRCSPGSFAMASLTLTRGRLRQTCGVMRRDQLEEIIVAAAAVAVPAVLTAILAQTNSPQREYAYLYMAVVAVIAFLRGLWPALLAAAVSFLLFDYFFVPPVHTLTIADAQDLMNLAIFFGTAGVVGFIAGRRREAQMRAESLARELKNANAELVRLNRDQAAAAQAAVRLARTEQQVLLLHQAEHDLSDLLATISHELRTPIGTILTDSTNMLRTQDMNTSVRYRIEGIATEARRLNRLLADMLSLGRIESGALHLTLEPVQVGDAVAAAAERLKRIAPDRKVEWDAKEAGVSALGDLDSLGQILDTLLDNANRFAPPGTPISVRVSLEAPGQVTIRVLDHGPGVPAAMRARLFNRFVKGPSDAGDGTGLGLAITRGLVEAHAGSILLEDGPPGETTFRFTIPKSEARAAS